MTCEAGYTLNDTFCTCSLSDICQLSPCQNEGSCTLVSAPFDYTCIALVLVIKDSIALLFLRTEIIRFSLSFFFIVLPDIDILLSSTQVVILEGNDLSVNCTVPCDVSYIIMGI